VSVKTGMTLRKRELPHSWSAAAETKKRLKGSGGPWIPHAPAGQSALVISQFTGFQETESEGHRWPPPKDKNSAKVKDVGGPFFTVRREYDFIPECHVTLLAKPSGDPYEYKYEGPARPNVKSTAPPFSPYPPAIYSSDEELDEYGATAISLCKPTNSIGDVQTLLGETVKDGIPSIPGSRIWKKRANAIVGLADEFLNYAFAILPTIKDISDIRKAAEHASSVLQQYERDAGKVVRRQFHFDKEITESTDIPFPSVDSVLQTWSIPKNGFRTSKPLGPTLRKSKLTRERWFSGAFTYYIPSGTDSWKALVGAGASADSLFGTTLDPDTIWELTPWSWAIDWFTNAGDVISNLQDFVDGGLVMHYGYIMEHTINEYSYFMPSSNLIGAENMGVGPLTLKTEVKVRRPASPFGFGLTWNDLSSFQLAILAALGITRSR